MRLFDTGLRIFGGFIRGFVSCVEALFGICLGVWSCFLVEAVVIRDDNEDTTRALMARYCPYI